MKKVLFAFTLAALLALAGGCTPAGPPDLTGLIYAIEGERILVVEGIESAEIAYEEWFENGHTAIFFTVDSDTELQKGGKKILFNQLKTGQTVEVWSTGPLMDSYPQQGTAKKVVVTAGE